MRSRHPKSAATSFLSLAEAPVILVANHTSHLDTALLVSVLPPRLRHSTIVAGAADYFFDRRWKAHMWAFLTAAIPIERQRVNRKSADLAAEMLEEGWNLLIYPEGGRSPDGWMQTFRPGAAYLAVRTGRPVVPVHLDGTFKVMARGGGRVRRSPTTVTFGLPIRPEPGEDARAFGRRIEAGGSPARDRAHDRLVDRPQAGGAKAIHREPEVHRSRPGGAPGRSGLRRAKADTSRRARVGGRSQPCPR